MRSGRPKPRVNLDYRPGTQDELVVREVLAANEYRLPERFKSTDAIVDVGAHIGISSVACLLRGAGSVWAYEADAENFSLLKKNLSGYIGAKCFHCAVWRSDRRDKLKFSGYPEGMNACGSTLPDITIGGKNMQIAVPSISLDEIIRKAGERTGRVRLIKIDCEGAEYPILLTSRMLGRVDEIVGEVHEFGGLMVPGAMVDGILRYDRDTIKKHLVNQGFDVEMVFNSGSPGGKVQAFNFYAKRPKVV